MNVFKLIWQFLFFLFNISQCSFQRFIFFVFFWRSSSVSHFSFSVLLESKALSSFDIFFGTLNFLDRRCFFLFASLDLLKLDINSKFCCIWLRDWHSSLQNNQTFQTYTYELLSLKFFYLHLLPSQVKCSLHYICPHSWHLRNKPPDFLKWPGSKLILTTVLLKWLLISLIYYV